MYTTAIIIGAGHAGLAMSRYLTAHAIDHIVFERGEVANSWKTGQQFCVLTPNWMSRLPGYGYIGDDPDGYRTMPETVAFIERYAEVSAAPVQTHTTVTSVSRRDDGYVVTTDRGTRHCRAIVLASGACNVANVPGFAEAVPSRVHTLTSMAYRNPDQLAEGGVLIVGASASGIQIATKPLRSTHLRSAITSARPASIGAVISSGGWTSRAFLMSATTTSRTYRGHGVCHRCNCWARLSAAPSISMPSRPSASSSLAVWRS